MNVETAVVPVAGWGTRMLPLSQLVAKEFLPLGRKPVIQHVAEELCAAGLKRIVFVTSRRKESLSRLFRPDSELESILASGSPQLLEHIWSHSPFSETEIDFVVQEKQLGLGHAVLCSKDAVGTAPFIVALGDCLIGLPGQSTLLQRMKLAATEKKSEIVIGFEAVAREQVDRYGIAKCGRDDSVFVVEDLIEKPKPEVAPSNLAACGRYLFTPEIFEHLHLVPVKPGSELQLTDAISRSIHEGCSAYGVKLQDPVRRYDVGSIESYVTASIEFALADESLRTSVEAAFSNDRDRGKSER